MFERHVTDELSAYLDNELSVEQKAGVEAHLGQCKECAAELSRLKALSEKMGTWKAPEPCPGFDAKVREKILNIENGGGRFAMKMPSLKVLVPSGVVAGLVLLVFINSYVTRGLDGRFRMQEPSGSYRDFAGIEQGSGAEEVESFAYQPMESRQSMRDRVAIKDKFHHKKVPEGLVAASGGNKLMFTNRQAAYAPLVVRSRISDAGEQYLPDEKIETLPEVEVTRQLSVSRAPAPVSEGPVIVIQPALPATGEGEKIIRSAQVRLEVADGKDAYGQLNEICRQAGGYLATSQLKKDNEGRTSGYITMRVPKDKFVSVLDKLRDFGTVKNISTDSQDVSQEYKNLKARLEAAMVVHDKMVEALKQRKATIGEAARLESELSPVLSRIEAFKNQLEAIDNMVSYTTISVFFSEPKVSLKVLEQSKQIIQESLINASLGFVRFFARVLPGLIVLVVVLIVLGIAAACLKGLIGRISKQ